MLESKTLPIEIEAQRICLTPSEASLLIRHRSGFSILIRIFFSTMKISRTAIRLGPAERPGIGAAEVHGNSKHFEGPASVQSSVIRRINPMSSAVESIKHLFQVYFTDRCGGRLAIAGSEWR